MAEEFVGKDQFAEFTKRMEQGFDQVNQRFEQINQRFEQVNQRFEQLDRSLDQMNNNLHADMRQMRNWLIGLYGIAVFGFIGSIFLTIIKSSAP